MTDVFKLVADEIYKPSRKHYPTRKVVAQYPDEIWSIDLADNNELLPDNNGYRYMVNVVDVFSRYAWSVKTKDKTGATILDAFKTIVKENHNIYPAHLWADAGGEFVNKEMNKWTEEHGITLYHTYGNSKSCIVERFNRTLKTNLWRYFTAARSRNWEKVLPVFIADYNKRKHRTINMTPKEAHSLDDEGIIALYTHQYGDIPSKNERPAKFKVGDYVRLNRSKEIFEKGYHPSWTMELFKVVKVMNTVPWTYRVDDLLKDSYEGSFYEQEMQLSKQDPKKDAFLVENVISSKYKRVGTKNKKYDLVKFMGYSDKHNAWIPAPKK